MGLREVANQDLNSILSDSEGFGWPVTVTDPSESEAALIGFSNDIGQTIDPDTGQAVVGRLASVALSMDSLSSAGLGLPKGVEDKSGKPWRVSFDDIQGNSYLYKVKEAMPDRALGIVTCILEAYSL